MGAFDNYRPEHTPQVAKGFYRVEIIDVDDKPSKKGDDMITVTVRMNTVNLRIKEYFVSGTQFFNAKLTKFYECFGIPLGNDEIRTWIGATGIVGIDKEKDSEYMRITRFIHPDSEEAKTVAPWEGPMPERQTITQLRSDAADPNEDSDDELPF